MALPTTSNRRHAPWKVASDAAAAWTACCCLCRVSPWLEACSDRAAVDLPAPSASPAWYAPGAPRGTPRCLSSRSLTDGRGDALPGPWSATGTPAGASGVEEGSAHDATLCATARTWQGGGEGAVERTRRKRRDQRLDVKVKRDAYTLQPCPARVCKFRPQVSTMELASLRALCILWLSYCSSRQCESSRPSIDFTKSKKQSTRQSEFSWVYQK